MVSVNDPRCEYRRDPLGIDAAAPRLSWSLASRERGERQTAYQVLVASTRENLVRNRADLWDSGQVRSADSVSVPYRGKPLAAGQRAWWKVRVWDRSGRPSRWSSVAFWERGLLSPGDWGGAVWINDGKPNPEASADFYKDDPAPLFRKPFICDRPVASARLYVSGLGYVEPYLNGARVGENVLDPGWTTVEKRVLYSVYDVTGQVRQGENCLGVMLGNGFYNPLPLPMWGGLNIRKHLSVGRPRLLARLEITHPDDTTTVVFSDETWQVAEGPILRNSVYLGEVYDARREIAGWSAPGNPPGVWRRVRRATEPIGPLRAQAQPPIRVTGTLKPKNITPLRPGVVIVDFGQNFAGVVHLRVRHAAPGTAITLRSGELLYPDGSLNPMTAVAGQIKNPNRDYGGAPVPAVQSDTYVCKGGGTEEWTPRFTFHGFRYVEVTGWPGTPGRDDLTGLRLSADLETVGAFSCSHSFLNRLYEVCDGTFLSNVFSVQSDCPHREKFGYGGDIVPTADAFALRYDMAGFYAKVADDFADAVRPNGGTTETAPFVGIADSGPGGGAGPMGWMVALPVLLDTLYRYVGDRAVIERHYEAVARLVDFVDAKSEGHIVPFCLGDHESLDPKPIAILATGFHYHQARLAAKFARLLSKNADAERFDRMAEATRAAFLARFLKRGTGIFDSGSQACQAAAFALDLVPPEERDAARRRLIESVERDHKGHIATGIFGTRFLLDMLSRLGEDERAFAIATVREFPGWRHMVDEGATTLWETWKFSDNTYSHNHPMFGSIAAWMMESVAGLRPAPDAVGFDKVQIRPGIVRDLTWAKARYRSVRGPIAVSWRKDGDVLRLDVELPVGVSGQVWLPARAPERITESGRPVTPARTENGRAVCEIGSGRYAFAVPL
jgi:alpha-L-rhamnosidase